MPPAADRPAGRNDKPPVQAPAPAAPAPAAALLAVCPACQATLRIDAAVAQRAIAAGRFVLTCPKCKAGAVRVPGGPGGAASALPPSPAAAAVPELPTVEPVAGPTAATPPLPEPASARGIGWKGFAAIAAAAVVLIGVGVLFGIIVSASRPTPVAEQKQSVPPPEIPPPAVQTPEKPTPTAPERPPEPPPPTLPQSPPPPTKQELEKKAKDEKDKAEQEARERAAAAKAAAERRRADYFRTLSKVEQDFAIEVEKRLSEVKTGDFLHPPQKAFILEHSEYFATDATRKAIMRLVKDEVYGFDKFCDDLQIAENDQMDVALSYYFLSAENVLAARNVAYAIANRGFDRLMPFETRFIRNNPELFRHSQRLKKMLSK